MCRVVGLVDLKANETGPVVRFIARHERERQGKSDPSLVAFPIVTGAWHNPSSHVPSPVVYTKPDGTQVTNFPQSLAIWAGVVDAGGGECPAEFSDSEEFDFLKAGETSRRFFDSIRTAIRNAEANRPSLEEARSAGPPFDCEEKARFGVSPDMARINYPFSPKEFRSMLLKGGFNIDYRASSVTKVE